MLTEVSSPTAKDLLWRLDGSLAGLTGRAFFQALTETLVEMLDARCAFVCEFLDGNTRAYPLVFWLDGGRVDVETYDLAGTPCETVLTGDVARFDRCVADAFPHHRSELEAINAESYLAIPMKDRSGAIIGHVAVIDIKPRQWADAELDALRICSSHATAELEHERAERSLTMMNRELEARVLERTRELEAAREELERRVEERTASLSAMNARLRHEIAARTEAESALLSQKEAYRDLYENAPNVYWSTGADGLIRRVNQRAQELFGVAPQDLVGKPFTTLVADTPNGLARARSVFERFLEGEATFGEELEFRDANGRTIWASTNVVPIFDDTGKPVATRTTLADITERKLAEQALQHRLDLEQLLTQVAAEFVSARPDDLGRPFNRAIARLGIWGKWDRARVFLYSPGRADPMLSYEWHADGVLNEGKEPLLTRRLLRRRDQLLDVPDVAASTDTELQKALQAGGAGGLIVVPVANASAWIGMLELVTFGRPHEWLREDVQFLGLLGELMASTLQRCAAESALEAARQEAEAASQAKSEFLARMSHELRTPLNAILGYAQLLQRDTTLVEPQQQQIETIHRSGEHLLNLINEVLDLARVEAGLLDIENVDLDLAALLRGVEAMFRPRTESAGLSFGCEMLDDCPRLVRTDDRRLRQILINLLGNAVKFTPRGGSVKLRAMAQTSTAPRSVLVFEIADSGIGISPEDMDKIFEPFVQVGSGNREGMGLGLAITRRLTEAFGGTLEVVSELGVGTTFRLTIEVETASQFTGAGDRAVSAVAGYAGRRRRLLIADDVAENRRLLVSLLRPLGFEIVEAEDGATAMAALEVDEFDAAILDLVMPEMDGFEVARRVREVRVSTPRLIALSANAFGATREHCFASGFDAFVPKPVDFDELLNALGQQLNLQWLSIDDSNSDAGRAADEVDSTDLVSPDLPRLNELLDCARSGDVVALRHRLENLGAQYAGLARVLGKFCERFDLRSAEQLLESLIARAASSTEFEQDLSPP